MLYRLPSCLRVPSRRLFSFSALFILFVMPLFLARPVLAQTPPLQVVVSVRPVALVVQELTQGMPVQVKTLLPQGATPHDYALKPSDIKAIAAADLVVWMGQAGEPYLKGAVAKAKRALDWSAQPGLIRLPLRSTLHEGHEAHDHHGHEHEGHDHGDAGYDLHFWMSMDNALLLAQALQPVLAGLLPQAEATLAQNQAQMQQRLQQQRLQTRGLLAQAKGAFLLSHDAYHYLEEDLDTFSDGAITLDPEIKPGIKHLMAIKARVQEHNIGCVLTDPTVSNALLDKVDRTPPLTRVAIDPLAWDYPGALYSEWLSSAYVKVVVCATVP
ncbi:MAG: zinc ABC transporter substrate-binding protein [Pseudomonadota bacterium]|nr:zinc ABC transporter substrate-binding protein [Pseudomonadota bacterium]